MRFKICEICDINKSNFKKNDSLEFINYLDTSNLIDGLILDIKTLYFGKDEIPSRAKRIINKNDILISTVRPNQKHYGIIKKPIKNMVGSTGFVVLSPKEDIVNSIYLYKYLTQDVITQYLQAIAETSTSAYPSIRPDVIGSLEIELPPLNEQKAIAKILSDLDEKIEINNRINKVLEEMAQAIFKRWFVDFEFPNENGEPYKSSGGEMVESELGPIPKGWEIIKLEDIGDFKNGINYNRDDNGNEKYKIVNVRDIVEEAFIVKNNLDNIMIYSEKAKQYILKYGDILIVRSASPGKVSILIKEYPNIIYSGFIILLRLYQQQYIYYIFMLLKDLDKKLDIYSNGTTLKNINQQILRNIKVILPDNKTILNYNNIIMQLFNNIIVLKEQNQTLSNLRDTLLPKLMSGEIRVPLD